MYQCCFDITQKKRGLSWMNMAGQMILLMAFDRLDARTHRCDQRDGMLNSHG